MDSPMDLGSGNPMRSPRRCTRYIRTLWASAAPLFPRRGHQRQLQPSAYAALLVNHGQRVAYRLVRDTQIVRDLAVGAPGENAPDDAPLSRRQLRLPWPCHPRRETNALE